MKKFSIAILTILMVVCTLFATACGKVEFKVDFVVDGQVYSSINTSGEETIKMPNDPEKEGYIFDGWYWDKDSWKKPFTANSLLDAPLSDNMSVYAKWTTIESLTGTQAEFDTFEKTGDNEYSLKVSNSTETLSLEPLVSLNSRSSWSLSTDIYGNQTIASRTATLTVGDNTYYALVTAEDGSTQLYTLKIRRKPMYNVIFDTAGGTSVDAQQIEEGALAVAPQTTREGYDFSAWNYDFTAPITENKIVVASWTAKQYTISYNTDGGNVANNTTTATYDSEYTLEVPTRRGYEFLGWYLDAEKVENGTWQTASNITLLAKWDICEYTISYDLKGGSVATDNPAVYTVASDNIILTAPSRLGYTFLGWTGTDISEPTMSVIIYTGSIGNKEYAANWDYDGYDITYHLDGGTNHENNPDGYNIDSANIYLENPTREGHIFGGWYTSNAFDAASKITVISTGSTGDKDLYAKWTPITYTIRFNKNASSATGTMNDQAFEYNKTQSLTSNLFARVGYVFVGWTTNADGTGTAYNNANEIFNLTATQGDIITLYAKWEANTYTVTLDRNGSNGGTGSVTATFGSAMPEATAPVRVGYTFMGYYTAISGGIRYYNADMTSARSWDLTEDTTLYARWSASTYTITFDKQGGSGTSSATATYGSSLPTVSKPTKTGHTFLGYYDAVVGGTQYYDADMSSTMTWSRTEGIMLYAHWEANEYTVSFNTNQGSGAQTVVTATYGEEMPEITVTPTRAGYIFLGYYDALTGGTKYYNADLTSANTWVRTSNSTLYARWQGVPYYVSFNANNGTGTMATQEFEYGASEYLNSNAFTRTGYTFAGWNTEADGSGTSYANTESVLNLTSVSGETVTLYAQWTAKTVTGTLNDLSTPHASYTVSFNLNGASGSIASQTVTETVGLTYPTIPTRSGYVFAGWYTTSSCSGSPYDFTADVTEDTTLYAKWVTISSYRSTISVGGSSVSAYINGTTVYYYPFVSLVNQTVTIYTTGSLDTYGYLYNSSKSSTLYSDDDDGESMNFSITYTVTAGTLYYIGVRAYSSSTSVGYSSLYVSGASLPTAGGKADGIVQITEQLTYDQNFTLDAPTKEGYTFLGWYDRIGGTGTQYTDATGASVRAWDKEVDTTLYAQWEANTYTVTLDRNGSNGGTGSVTATYDSAMPEATAPTRVGYTFMGYYTAISGGTKYYNADMTSARVCDLTENTTLYARWSASTYTITFDKQGGSGTSSATATYGSTLPTVSKPTKTGHTFLGYYDAAVGGTQYYDANMSSTITWTRTEGITLYAHWEANEYTVSFNTNQGSGAQTVVTATYGEEMPEITVTPTRAGYIFLGYYDALTGGTKYYNADLTSANTWARASNTTLYARWQGVPYYVSFNANSGTGTMGTQEFEYGASEYLNSNAFTRTGYTFAGWNTEVDGSGTSYANTESVLNLTSVSGETVTLYAQWTAKTVTGTLADLSTPHASYTVSFNLNGASGSIASQTVTETVGLTYPTIPTRSGYVFAGWYTTSSCSGSPYDFTADVTENITLYAKWVAYSGSGIIPTDGSSYQVYTTNSSYSYYAFVPLVTGTVSYNAIDWDSHNIDLCDSSKNAIDWNNKASASGTLAAGTLYYIRYKSSSGSQYITIKLTVANPTAGGKADGIVQVTEQLTYDQNFTLDVPTKEGYNFLGWYDGIDGTGTQYTDATGASVRVWDKEVNTTLYAKWEVIESTVIFDKQNGAGGSSSVTAIYDSAMPEATAPVRVGYTFMGYYTAISGGTKYYNADMTSARAWDFTENTTLYARWSANTYTITFDKQGGSGTSSATATYGSTLPTVSKPTKTGHTFLGYYDAAVGGTQYYDADMSSTMTWSRTEGIILYAHWEASEYTVSFNTNQGSGAQTVVTATYGEEMPEITVVPTRAGYIFLGYYDALTGGTKYYNADLTSANTWARASNTTLYARWQGVPYYVSFNANNGTGTMATQEFEYGASEYLNSNAFTRTGYTFAGWNTEADGSGTSYANTESVLNLTSVSGETVTLYAQWTAKTVTGTLADLSTPYASYTVSFDLNGASGSIPSQIVTETVGLTYPTIPTRSGYIFAGWYANSGCTGTPYDFTADVTENITLYAKWIYPSSYTKILTLGGNTGSTSYSSTIKYYPFVSLVNQTITIYTSHSSGDPKIYLYDASKNQLTYDDDGYGSNNDSKITYTVTAGTLYYAGFGCWSSSSGTGYMYLTGTTCPTAGGKADGIVQVTEQLTYDQNFTLDVPTKEGYNFLGWYDGIDGTGTQYTDATGASVRAWDKEVDTTLYAKWNAIEYSITYELNGGENSDNNPSAYNIATEDITLSAPTKAGYSFIGWTTESITVPTKNLVINMGSMGDITLTANWIEYDVNDITYNSSKKDFGIFDELTAEYFGAQCVDTDGNRVNITATFVTAPVAGETTSVLLVATSGGKTTQTIIENVKIYGTPTINVGNTSIKSTASMVASTFDATATDSFGNTLSVSVSLIEGDTATGGYRTYEFTATDRVGNEASVNTVVMVYSADDIDIVVNDVLGINVGSAGAEFGAVASDSFGDDCTVEFEVVSGNVSNAGTTVNVRFIATDVMGNTSTITINNVKAYGTPVATMNVSEITDSTPANEVYSVRDSFGVVLDASVTYVNTPVAGENVTIRIVAVDAIGNQFNTEYVLPVICTYHAIGANCTCEVCGTTEHMQGDSCICLVCGSGSHDLNVNCVCRDCGITAHSLNANCVCTACGNEFHNDNGEGTCVACGTVLNTADVWDGTIASSFARGSGTSSNPYIIETGAQLAYLASRVNSGTSYSGCYFKLDNDIDLNNINWTPIGKGTLTENLDITTYAFYGSFDGNGYTILNLHVVNNTTSFAGLFGKVYNSTICNVRVENANVQNIVTSGSRSKVGTLVGYAKNATILGCAVVNATVRSEATSAPTSAGGLVGIISNTNVRNSFAFADVYGNGYVGGLVGGKYNSGVACIENCYAVGSLYSTDRSLSWGSKVAGGIVGYNESDGLSIYSCVFIGTISCASSFTTGAISGHTATKSNCYYYLSSSNNTLSLSNFKLQSWLTSTLGWDFDTVWTFVDGYDYPVLKAFN